MTRPSIRLRAACPAALIAMAGLGACRGANADVQSAYYIDGHQYWYKIAHMPDLDQIRTSGGGAFGLPGDGVQYCVPTSSLNMVAYAASHGFPDINPGPGYWQLQSNYTSAGLNILNMGNFMGTSSTTGTTGNGWINGLKDWLAANGKFTATHYIIGGSYVPRMHRMAKIGIDGSLVSLAYGRYDIDGFVGEWPLLGTRTSGHIVTLVDAYAHGPNDKKLGVHDPGDDPDSAQPDYTTTQSPFGIRYLNPLDITVYVCPWIFCPMTMTSLNYSPSNPQVALIDEYTAIKPKQGYSFTSGGGLITLHVFSPVQLLGSNKGASQSIVLAANPAVLDVVIEPDLVGYLVLREGDASTGDGPSIQHVDAVTEAVINLIPVPDATRIVVGRKRNLYVLAGDELRCVDLDDPDVPVTATMVMPGVGDALAYDDATDDVVVLSIAERAFLRYQDGLPAGIEPFVTPVPVEVPLAGRASVAIQPSSACDPGPCSNETWFVTEASSDIHGMTTSPLDGGAAVALVQISLPEVQDPTDLDFDDAGHLFVCNEGGVDELAPDELGGWTVVPAGDSFFGDVGTGMLFRVTRSRTNFDPVLHTGPGWVHIDPLTGGLESGAFVAECPGDFNDDRMVDILDLLDLLAAWGPCEPCFEDTNRDRVVDIYDLLDTLANWGVCP